MRKLIWVASGLLVGLICAGIVSEVQASRNSSGTYSLFAGTTPVVSNQQITSSLWNNAFNDLAADMTNSLDRNGRGGMLFQLRGIDGTLAAPAFSFTSESGTGYFRNGAGDLRLSILGSAKGFWSATGLGIGAAPTYPLDVQAVANTNVNARFLTSGGMPLFVVTAPTIARLGFNLTSDAGGTNPVYGVSSGGAVLNGEPASSAVAIYTVPTGGTAGNTAVLTERFRVNPSGVTIGAAGTAIGNLVVGGCTTAGAGVSTCTITAPSGGKCVCTIISTGGIAKCTSNVVGTTATLYSDVASPAAAICWN